MENTDKTQANTAAPKGDDKTNTNPTNSAIGKTPGNTPNAPNAQSGKSADAGQQGSEISGKIGDVLSGDTGAIKDVYNSAKESTGAVASQAYGFATKKATAVIDEQKATLTQGLTSVADSIRQIGDNLGKAEEPTGVAKAAAQYTNTAAEKVEQISGYLENQDFSGLVRDLKGFARSNPALFLGGAFTLGILASRFLKSGASTTTSRKSLNASAKLQRSDFADDGVHMPENLDTKSKSRSGGDATSGKGSQNRGG